MKERRIKGAPETDLHAFATPDALLQELFFAPYTRWSEEPGLGRRITKPEQPGKEKTTSQASKKNTPLHH